MKGEDTKRDRVQFNHNALVSTGRNRNTSLHYTPACDLRVYVTTEYNIKLNSLVWPAATQDIPACHWLMAVVVKEIQVSLLLILKVDSPQLQ